MRSSRGLYRVRNNNLKGSKLMNLRKYKITYKKVLKPYDKIIEASSKYDAKQRFYREYPHYQIVKVEEVVE